LLRGGWGGAKSNDSEKVWSSINHLILSGGFPYIDSVRNSMFSPTMSQGQKNCPYFATNFEFFKIFVSLDHIGLLYKNRSCSIPCLCTFKGAQVWDFDVLDFYDFFIMKSI
jgi:hypothetical protein